MAALRGGDTSRFDWPEHVMHDWAYLLLVIS